MGYKFRIKKKTKEIKSNYQHGLFFRIVVFYDLALFYFILFFGGKS